MQQPRLHTTTSHSSPLVRNKTPNSVGSTKKVYQNRGLSLDSNSLFATTPIHSHIRSNESKIFVPDNASEDSKIDLEALDTESSLDYLPSDDEEDDEEYEEKERKEDANERDHEFNGGNVEYNLSPYNGEGYQASENRDKTKTMSLISTYDFVPIHPVHTIPTYSYSNSNSNSNLGRNYEPDYIDSGGDYYGYDGTQEDYDDNEDLDEEHGYLEKIKAGDKLQTTWQMEDNQDKMYKSLNILEEVKKLKKLKFFNDNYIENLNNLKLSQLGLLIDMVKMNENSFDEFYQIWNKFEEFSIEDDEDVLTNELAQFDINNSEAFKNLNVKNDLIVADLKKIKESISKIDSYTKNLWDEV